MNPKALFNMTYGMFLLTTREEGKDYGCIINTAVQVARDPERIAISVQNNNKTCEVLKRTELFNLSALTTDAPFDLFRQFGICRVVDSVIAGLVPQLQHSAHGRIYPPVCQFIICLAVQQQLHDPPVHLHRFPSRRIVDGLQVVQTFVIVVDIKQLMIKLQFIMDALGNRSKGFLGIGFAHNGCNGIKQRQKRCIVLFFLLFLTD